MAYLPVEGLLPRAAGSSYKLVRMIATRALEIGEGAAKLVEAPANEKPATTAMREVLAGKLMTQETVDQAKKAAKAAKASKEE